MFLIVQTIKQYNKIRYQPSLLPNKKKMKVVQLKVTIADKKLKI